MGVFEGMVDLDCEYLSKDDYLTCKVMKKDCDSDDRGECEFYKASEKDRKRQGQGEANG